MPMGRMIDSRFWRFVVVWALAVGTIAVVRPVLFPMRVVLPDGYLPEVGHSVEMPLTVPTLDGELLPTAERDGLTLFLITAASCEPCRKALEAGEFHEFLSRVRAAGLASRMLVIPAGDLAATTMYLSKTPPGEVIVIDSMGLGNKVLGSRITPAIVIVDHLGTVLHSSQWPPDWPKITQTIR